MIQKEACLLSRAQLKFYLNITFERKFLFINKHILIFYSSLIDKNGVFFILTIFVINIFFILSISGSFERQNQDAFLIFYCHCFVLSMSLNCLFLGGYFGFYAPQALTAQQLTAAGNQRHASGQIAVSVTSLPRPHCSRWAARGLRLAPNSRHHAHRGGPAPGSRDQDPVEKS